MKGDLTVSQGEYLLLYPLDHENRPRRTPWLRRVALVTTLFSVGFVFHSCQVKEGLERVISSSLNVANVAPQEITLPPGVSIKDCVPWVYDELPEGGPFKAHTSLQLPVDSAKLFFLKEGSALGGLFKVVQTDEVSDTVDIGLKIKTKRQDAVDLTRICSLGSESGGDGLGILAEFPPSRDHVEERIDITVSLPKSSSGDVLKINSFETSLPIFAHIFKNLGSSVFFDQLTITGAVTPVSAETIVANEVKIETNVAPVSGTFNVSDSLYIKTSSHRLDITANLFNDPEKGDATSVDLLTTLGGVKGTVNLFSQSKSKSKSHCTNAPSFNIHAESTATPVTLTFPFIQAGTILNLNTSTTLGPTQIQLHEAFVGKFNIESGRAFGGSAAKVTVRTGDEVVDPEGRGRKRVVEFSKRTAGVVAGRVGWGELTEEGEGLVDIKTTLGTAELSL